jgi:hypothetical protein
MSICFDAILRLLAYRTPVMHMLLGNHGSSSSRKARAATPPSHAQYLPQDVLFLLSCFPSVFVVIALCPATAIAAPEDAAEPITCTRRHRHAGPPLSRGRLPSLLCIIFLHALQVATLATPTACGPFQTSAVIEDVLCFISSPAPAIDIPRPDPTHSRDS